MPQIVHHPGVSPDRQLDGFIDRFTDEIAELGRWLLAEVRALSPGGVEMVYDNYNALVVGFGPTERSSQAVLSVVFYPQWMALGFLHGVGLPDPHGLLIGEGNQVRGVRVHSREDFLRPGVKELVLTAFERAVPPFDPTVPSKLVVKSVSAKQRPRRPKGA